MTHHVKMTEPQRLTRTRQLITAIALAKTEALALGLMYTFRALDRAEKVVGYEMAAVLEANKHGQTRFWEKQVKMAADAALDQMR